ncbi:leucine-rich repeat domain-containing protein [Kineosporia sp. NBRC 101731]|uniref:leucine-rich repeat domain-containing protein n=1 Tax=Kineosporia sp. NBRC 101731 TaxID=3032199 RepID=UPI0024A05755|nr:leucine-rich repeat domain-containing protein [Kineosporia sp. NBRC 101731]GLY32597.1 hypothetical protein Kisp02_59620 [Kineosporia sp. NBRC 101731]
MSNIRSFGPFRSWSGLPSTAALTAVASVLTALYLWHLQEFFLVMIVVMAAFGCAPALVAAVRAADGRAQDAWGRAAVPVGLAVFAGGVYLSWRWDVLSVLQYDFPLDQEVTNAAGLKAPVWVVLIGFALLLAGAAQSTGERVIGVAAVVVTAFSSGTFALALLGYSARSLHYYGGAIEKDLVAAAALEGCATLLFVAVAVRRGPQAPATRAPDDPVSRSLGVRLASTGISLALVAGAGVWAYHRFGERVIVTDLFEDPALAGCVATGLGLSHADDPTTEHDLENLFDLDCNGDRNTAGRIRRLEGIEHLPQLSSLDLRTNEISDLASLEYVPSLRSLTLTNNRVRDLTPLAGLTGLSNLGLSNNRIADLTPLAGLKGLTDLGLSGNRITDLTPLTGLTAVTEVDLSRNRITALDPLAGMSGLYRLTLRDNRVSDVKPLSGLPYLHMLNISGNRIRTASGLAGLKGIDELWLGGNPVRDLTPLTRLPALQGLDLEGNDPANLSGLADLRDQGVYVGGFA